MHILLVCDQSSESERLKRGLQKFNYAVDIASCAAEAESMIHDGAYDAVVAQEGGSAHIVDAVKVTRRLRDAKLSKPVLVVPEAYEEPVITEAFDAGADQVMDPHHSFNELLARIRGLLRQCEATPGEQLSYRDVEIDLTKLVATRAGKPLGLIGKPFAMLEFFLRHPEKVLSRESIGHSVWDRNFDPFSNVIDVTVSKVRQRLDKPFEKPYLHTVVGSGYMLSEKPPGHTEWG